MLQPVVLVGEIGKPKYKLLIGQRRFLAHQTLKRKTIRAIFVPPGDRFRELAQSLAENLLRVEINHADAAKAVEQLYKHYGGDTAEVMKATGLSRIMIGKYLSVQEQASDHMRELLRQGRVKLPDVRRAIRAAGDNIKDAEYYLDVIAEQGLTSHEKTRMVRLAREHPRESPHRVVEEARQPIVEQSTLLPLPPSVDKALKAAAKALYMEPVEIAVMAIEEWLHGKGFM